MIALIRNRAMKQSAEDQRGDHVHALTKTIPADADCKVDMVLDFLMMNGCLSIMKLNLYTEILAFLWSYTDLAFVTLH